MTPYELAKKEVGTLEWAKGDNPKVVAYYRDAGHPEVKHDDVPWCAAFVGAMIKRAGGKPSGSLAAQSYLQWGTKVDPKDIREGDIVVIKRGTQAWQGHVFFATGKPANGYIKGLGGNQSDAVNIATHSMSAFLGARRWPGPETKSVVIPVEEFTPAPKRAAKPSRSFWADFAAAIAALFGKRK